MSNTKLNADQKSDLKAYKAGNPTAEFFSFPEHNVTVLMFREFPRAKMVRVSVSVSSSDEQKFRIKVGEYNAANNMELGEFIKVNVPDRRSFEFAENMAALATM